MQDKLIELKPCPFCGCEASPNGRITRSHSPDLLWRDGSEAVEAFYCNCVRCGAKNGGIAGGYQTRDEAISHWNTRAAVRVHDAGTDETERDSSGDSRIPACPEGLYSWAQIEDAILTRWDGSEELEHWLKLLRYELKIDPEPPASHAAESAPPIPFEDWWASLGKCIDPDTEDVPWFDKRKGLAEAAYCAGQSSVEFAKFYSHTKAAESTAQLDAEDQHRAAEPVEDVVSRMCKLMGGCACEHCIKRMTAALAVAREGYVKLADVERAFDYAAGLEQHEGACATVERFIRNVRSRLAPKPSPDPAVEDVKCILYKRFGILADAQPAADQIVESVRKSDAALVEMRTK